MDIARIEIVLREAGFSKSEVSIYLFLLEHGYSTPLDISLGTGIQRTNCYNVLHSLLEKGFILLRLDGKKKQYAAEKPSQLLTYINERKKNIEQLLPDLEAAYTLEETKPGVTFYQGTKQVKRIYDASLEATTICAIGSTQHLSNTYEELLDEYFANIKKKKIYFRDLITVASRGQGEKAKQKLKDMYDVRVLPKEYGDQTTDILIWDDKIALMTFGKISFGTVLKSKSLVKTFQNIFDTLYQNSTSL